MSKIFSKFLPPPNPASVIDINYSKTLLLCTFDNQLNRRGLPFYSDMSIYKRHIIYNPAYTGSIESISSTEGNGYIDLPRDKQTNVKRYAYFNNIQARNNYSPSILEGLYSEISANFLLGCNHGSNPIALLEDFTIEFSFYSDTVFANNNNYQCLFALSNYSQHFSIYLEESNPCKLFIRLDREIRELFRVELFTWYSVALIRDQGKIGLYVNNVFVKEFNFPGVIDKSIYTFSIGALVYGLDQSQILRGNMREVYSTTGSFANSLRDSAFNGGLSNLRITEGNRYKFSPYKKRISFPSIYSSPKINNKYSDLIFYYPFVYDLFDYSPNKNHFNNKKLWNTPLLEGGGLVLNNIQYTTSPKSLSLSGSWCLEFYLGYFYNKVGYPHRPRTPWWVISGAPWGLALENRFLRITSNGFDVLELGYYINTKGVNNIDPVYFSVCQFYLKYSPDGREYFNFSNEDWKIPELDTTRTYFLNYGYDRTDAPRKENTEEFRSWHEGHPLHIAIQYSSNVLSFLVNGVPKYSYLILGNLFIDGNYTLTLGERFYDPIPVTLGYATNPIQDEVFFTISGLRFTNNSVYDTSEDANNNPWFENSLQPIPIALGQLEQPRCRVIDILRKSRSAYTDAEEIKWLVLFSQEVQNLSLEDFSLTQLNGLTGSTIKEIIPTNNSLVYEVVVQTGTGKGEIILNFIDRRTLFYKGTNVLISSFVGELSYEGQSYFINKTNPIPVVFSTTSPYVFDTFQVIVDLKYPLEKIGDIDPSKFSIVNGEIVSFSFIDTKVKDRLAVVIKPIERGAIYFQCQYSLFFTPTGLPSLQSNTLIRVFDAEAVVLLLPLNSITGLNDISPSQITFNQVVPNSVVFDNQVFPPGETSSLFVSPLLEQSGIFYKNFEITKFIQVSNFFSSRVDLSWQYEFFYRTTTNTNTLLIEFNKEGISNFIKVQNGKVIITSRIDGASSIIPTNIDNIPNQWNHFAVNYRNGIVRVYFNGERKYIGYIPLQKPFDCNIFIGYKETFVNFNDYHFSNLRVIVGKILYSNLTYTIPRLPYDIPLQIKELSTTIIYATIYSNNQVGNRAISGNNIFLGFNTVAPIKGIKVKINGIEKTANVIEPSHYTASFLVDDSFPEGVVSFEIIIPSDIGIEEKVITETTDGSFVVIENTPFTVMINALDVKSNSNIFNLAIQTNKKVANFSPQRFSSSNCIITNLITIDDFNYRALVRVLNSGIVTISIPAENLVSVTGLRNQESNIYSNTFILPSIVPDPYWDNVIFYLLGDSLNDQSQYNLTVDTTNVSLDYDITPPGLSSSLRFNGTTSRINVNLGQTLSAVIDYTIELFIYCRGDISFTLNPPILNPPNAVRSRSFQLTWSPVDNATSYRLFVSPSPTFSVETKMFTTQNNEIQIGSEKGSIEIEKEYLSSSKEIGFKVKKNPSLLGEFFISQDSNFNSYRTILSKDFWIGGQKGVLKGVEEVEAVTPSLVEPKYILQGIIGNIQTPFLFFLPQENTLRYYNKLDYSLPAYYEEVEISKWFYIALVNNSAKRRMELYVNGEFVDKSQASNFNQFLSIGFSLGGFNGNLAGIRITKGVKRSINEETYLPYGVQI